jgi:ubiquinone/menaquinone biosynthesis C-methylase UbiE
VKQSSKSQWNIFWSRKQEVGEVYSNSDRIRRNLTRITDLKGKKVLEVGAGTGRDSFTLVGLGAKVYQLDYSENALRIIASIARQENISVHPLCGDALALPFHEETFDIVIHQGLLEHFREPDAINLIKENVRVLKRGGLLLVDVPQRWHVYTIMKHILIAFNAWFAGWEREFSIRDLRKILKSNGLTRTAEYGEWMYPSLLYRIIREALRFVGIKLPMYPKTMPGLTAVRKSIRERMMQSVLVRYTGLSIGIIGRK